MALLQAWEQRASGDLELAALKENISSVHSRLEVSECNDLSRW